jgi:hypothetical protein
MSLHLARSSAPPLVSSGPAAPGLVGIVPGVSEVALVATYRFDPVVSKQSGTHGANRLMPVQARPTRGMWEGKPRLLHPNLKARVCNLLTRLSQTAVAMTSPTHRPGRLEIRTFTRPCVGDQAHAGVRLTLRPSGDGWSLVGPAGQLVFHALGADGRRSCLEFAPAAGIRCLTLDNRTSIRVRGREGLVLLSSTSMPAAVAGETALRPTSLPIPVPVTVPDAA